MTHVRPLDAVAREALAKASYNVSIVAIEEAKGTLLEHDKIAVVEGPEAGSECTLATIAQRGHPGSPGG